MQEYNRITGILAKAQELNQTTKDNGVSLETVLNQLMDFVLTDPEEKSNILQALLEIAKSNKTGSIDELSQAIEVSDERIEQEIEPGKVNILTMHKAKGLTADIVFILAAEDEHIPGKYEKEPELGDERRLLYVSLTRAKHRLIISYCNERIGQQKMLGRNTGNPRRSLTQFLRDSPLRPEQA